MRVYAYELELDECNPRGLEFAFKGKGVPPPPAPLPAPTPPVEEASVEIDDESRTEKKRLKTGKASLKLPLADSPNTGLKV